VAEPEPTRDSHKKRKKARKRNQEKPQVKRRELIRDGGVIRGAKFRRAGGTYSGRFPPGRRNLQRDFRRAGGTYGGGRDCRNLNGGAGLVPMQPWFWQAKVGAAFAEN
jgi:hypothetical protein